MLVTDSSFGKPAVGAAVSDAFDRQMILLIQGQYLEIPRLHLTREQVQRLWDLDAATCDRALTSLVRAHFLERQGDDGYVRVAGRGA